MNVKLMKMSLPQHSIIAFLSLMALAVTCSANEQLFQRWDKNGDGFLSKTEVPENQQSFFDRKDKNNDGKISLSEHLNRPRKSIQKDTFQPTEATFTIHQAWPQEPSGYDRPVHVSEPDVKPENVPVLIYFHGNGGSAARSIKSWARRFPNYLVIAPQGYLNCWNIQGEKSKAPDVSFYQLLIGEVQRRYPYSDTQQITVVGSSNGAGLIYRLLIELKPEFQFESAITMVSSLLESQYHDNSFWRSSDESNTDQLTIKTMPKLKENLRVLYIHGTADKVVPFEGGKRFNKFQHHSAQASANILARQMGYNSNKPTPANSENLGNGLLMQRFEGTSFNFIAVKGGNHGLAPHREAVMTVVKKFIEGSALF